MSIFFMRSAPVDQAYAVESEQHFACLVKSLVAGWSVTVAFALQRGHVMPAARTHRRAAGANA
jgi:hypothetical protein